MFILILKFLLKTYIFYFFPCQGKNTYYAYPKHGMGSSNFWFVPYVGVPRFDVQLRLLIQLPDGALWETVAMLQLFPVTRVGN